MVMVMVVEVMIMLLPLLLIYTVYRYMMWIDILVSLG